MKGFAEKSFLETTCWYFRAEISWNETLGIQEADQSGFAANKRCFG